MYTVKMLNSGDDVLGLLRHVATGLALTAVVALALPVVGSSGRLETESSGPTTMQTERKALLDGRIVPVDRTDWPDGATPNAIFPRRSSEPMDMSGRIAFETDRDSAFNLYVKHAGGGSLATTLVTSGGNDVTPVWSPDGGQVVFASDRGGDYDIYLRTASGQEHKLTHNAADDVHPAWSPSGDRIIFSSDRSGSYFQVYTMRADGSDVRQVGVVPGNNAMYPRYSPNGSRIAFMRASVTAPLCQWNWDVWLMNADGSNQRRVTTSLVADVYPNWKPDGSAIIYGSCRNFLDFDLYLVNPDTGAESQLNAWFLSNEWGAVYSPDGQSLAFDTDYEGDIEIYTAPAAGGTASNFTLHMANDLSPSWGDPSAVPTYSISGRVTGEINNPVPGVTISTGVGHTAITDAAGNYALTGLFAGTYTLTPSDPGYTFSPALRSATVPPDATDVDFRAYDAVSPDGRVTSPEDGTTIGHGTIMIAADAWDNPGGSGVARVDFYVSYDGIQHWVDSDDSVPYTTTWSVLEDLRSQQLRFSVFLVDNAGNGSFGSESNLVTFLESSGAPDVSENWVPRGQRAYLNQRSLPSGDSKCSAASMSMVLAMSGLIDSDYDTMASKANDMYPNVLVNGTAYVYQMRNELRNQGAASEYVEGTAEQGWQKIKQEVDAGRAVIVRTEHGVVTAAGHFFVAVGYRETSTERQIINYDPYGRWQGTCCQNNYDKNSQNPNSHKGRWVLYDFNRVFGNYNYLITASPPPLSESLTVEDTPDTAPDEISTEPEDIDTYLGVPTGGSTLLDQQVFLPLTLGSRSFAHR